MGARTSVALFLAFLFGAAVSMAQDRPHGEPGDDPPSDTALECLTDTTVLRYSADPREVEPFEDTTLSWEVRVPPGCPVALSIAGRRIERTGTLVVTPVHVATNFDLIGRMLGATTTLATARVTVDQSTCRDQVLPQGLVVPPIEAAIDEFDAEDDDFKQIQPPQIQVQSNRLFIRMVVKAEVTGFPDPTVTLDMGLRFTVHDGVIEPHYTLFRPSADTALPDDFVHAKFFDRSDDILADFKSGFNDGIGAIIEEDEQLFDLTTEPFQLRATKCTVEPPSPPRLTVQLRVLPQGDPGRFNLRVDEVPRKTNAGDGDSIGSLELDVGRHVVSQTAALGTTLGDYRSLFGGDCAADGSVTLAPGDVKLCFLTNVREAEGQECEDECRQERDDCMDDPETTPQICIQLFKLCMASCN